MQSFFDRIKDNYYLQQTMSLIRYKNFVYTINNYISSIFKPTVTPFILSCKINHKRQIPRLS